MFLVIHCSHPAQRCSSHTRLFLIMGATCVNREILCEILCVTLYTYPLVEASFVHLYTFSVGKASFVSLKPF
jgi:hypothetical protein